MDTPHYTVIIPMARYQADQPALASLRAMPPPDGGVQILVAEGVQPARQRNIAVGRAQGDIVVFLDNDCSPSSGYWEKLAAAFARPEVEIVGGPARLRPDAGAWEQIFHALLTHALVVGTVSSRYAPRGKFRAASQTDLILCNLAVRRPTFARIGPLSSDLYPNEENEWLDRAHAAGVGAYYDPDLQIFRPQRASPAQMFLTLFRYGMGRTRQFRVSGWRPTFHQFLPVMLLASLAALIHWRLGIEFIALWLVASAVIALTCDAQLRDWKRVVAGLVAPLIPLMYVAGQVIGWIALFFPAPDLTSEIVLLNERGERV